ncbi:hypothetical protein [Carboxylicivirga caseinilyticus]|uniref:hypothetical protein n=1 Tax=Carboxylicivirga caseinilyticus TaxID=3417572 RepID=UPI003D33E973|nr:hypothetical protein [Marinilabiliaceae bacterium A049]
MILERIDIKDQAIRDKLLLSEDVYKAEWQHYYDCYLYSSQLVYQSVANGEMLNPIGIASTFLLRHNLELLIKFNLKKNNITFPNTHNFQHLYDIDTPSNFYPEHLREAILLIDKDEDGSCYRYHSEQIDGVEKKFFPSDTQEEREFATLELHNFFNKDTLLNNTQLFTINKVHPEYIYEGNRTKLDYQI